ncbi:DUF6053 domain-containing protein [Lysobacter enzymogenes]|uniref:DUF6053 domain-containing protein n=1 Tax=Lysobacter enzymogenes TaxID=69 RepID=UPI003D2F818D
MGPMRTAFVGGASAPMLLFQIAAIRAKSIGAEAPPTRACPADGARCRTGDRRSPVAPRELARRSSARS